MTEELSYQEKAFYQSECNKRGVRIYPVSDYNMYILIIEFNKSPKFEGYALQSLVKGDTRYEKKGTLWVEKIFFNYKKIYETRIKPRLDQGKEVFPGTIRPVYNKAG